MLAYWKMLWLNRLAVLKPQSWMGEEGKGRIGRLIGYGALALLVLTAYAMAVALEMFAYTFAQQIGDPEALLALAALGCTLVTLIYSFFTVISLLFFGRDTAFLAALPIRSGSVLFVKLTTVLLSESGVALLICAPLLIRHGVAIGAGFGYYLRALLGILVLPGIPVAITTALSFVLIRLSALWKRREGVTVIATFLFMGLIIFGEMMLTLNMEEEEIAAAVLGLIFGRASISRLVMNIYLPLEWLMNGLNDWGYALLFAGVSAAAVALVVALFGNGYMGLAIRQAEIRQRENAAARRAGRTQRVRSPFWALYRQEMKEVITVPSYATNCLAGVVMFPVMIVIMYIAIQQELSGPALTLLASVLNPALYLAIAAGVLALTCTMNMAVPTAVSREGARHELRRTYPVSGRVQLGAKLLMGLSYNAVTAVVCAAVLCALLPVFWLETVIAFGIAQVFSLLWSMIGLLIDVYRPKFNWKTEAEAVKQSMNAMIGMLLGLGVLLALAGAAALCWRLGWPMWTAIAADTLVMVIGCALLWKWLMNHGAKTYSFKELSNL